MLLELPEDCDFHPSLILSFVFLQFHRLLSILIPYHQFSSRSLAFIQFWPFVSIFIHSCQLLSIFINFYLFSSIFYPFSWSLVNMVNVVIRVIIVISIRVWQIYSHTSVTNIYSDIHSYQFLGMYEYIRTFVHAKFCVWIYLNIPSRVC